MATVQIRNLNDNAYAVLRARAAESGRSLQEYLRRALEREAAQPSLEELLTDIRGELTGSLPMTAIVKAQRACRGD